MVFGIASITKVFVAAVVLQLAEEGVVGLDDPVEAWLAPLPNVDGSATVRQLLNHTSGVFDFADHPAYVASISSDPTRRWTAEQTIADFVLGPYAEPGVVFRYSSTGYLLLGMIIERATGSTVSAELRSRVLDPLGLANTFFAPDEAIEGVLAEPWADFDGNGVLDNIAFVPRDSGDSTLRSSGNMYSTALDVARFLRSLMEGEVLEQSSLAEMLDLRPASASFSYGLGIQGIHEFVDGTTGIGHDGGTYGYSTRMIGLPNQRVYIALLMNHSSASPADDYDTIQAISRSLAAAALGIEPDDGSPTFESERAGRRR
jgi:D-alanyl-D-alanine carboxypeptidase